MKTILMLAAVAGLAGCASMDTAFNRAGLAMAGGPEKVCREEMELRPGVFESMRHCECGLELAIQEGAFGTRPDKVGGEVRQAVQMVETPLLGAAVNACGWTRSGRKWMRRWSGRSSGMAVSVRRAHVRRQEWQRSDCYGWLDR